MGEGSNTESIEPAERPSERTAKRRLDCVAIGRRIREARESAGMTQAALASGLVSKAYISRIENGERRARRNLVQQFAERLGVPPEKLLRSPDDAYWARVGLAQARIQLLTGDTAESRFAAGGVATSTAAAADESVARETVRLEALACLNDHDFPRARALLEWLDRGDLAINELPVLAALCRCYLQMGYLGRAVEVGQRAVTHVADSNLIGLPEATEALYWYHRALISSEHVAEAHRVADWALTAQTLGGEPLAQVLLNAGAAEVNHDRAARAASLVERAESILDLLRQRALLDDLRAWQDAPAVTAVPWKSDNMVWQNE